MKRTLVALAISCGAAVPLVAVAAPGSHVALEADAIRTPSGPVVRFTEGDTDPDANAPIVRSLRITRPGSVGVAVPQVGETLGGLNFFIGPHTCQTCPERRSLGLARVRSLAGGSYVVGSGRGARVVLSTRDRSRFLRVTLPTGARNVVISLTRTGARLLRFPRCETVRFGARFELREGATTDGDPISGRRLRRAGLC
jgi:hypothetical protein